MLPPCFNAKDVVVSSNNPAISSIVLICNEFEVKRVDILLFVHQVLVIVAETLYLNARIPLTLVLDHTLLIFKLTVHV